MPRVFVAALPTDAITARLARLRRPGEPGVRWVPPANLHVTLRFVGTADVDDIADRLVGVRLPRCTARLGPGVERLGPRLLVIPVLGLDPLAAAIRDATAGIGEDDHRPFRGHLTIARTAPRAKSSVLGKPFTVGFDVDEVVVMRSDPQPTGPVYTTVARVATH